MFASLSPVFAAAGRLLLLWLVLAGIGAVNAREYVNPENGRVIVRVAKFYNPSQPETATTKRLIELMEDDQQIEVRQWGGLQLPGGAGRAPLMMAIAGKTAPDIMESWFHIIGNDIHQGFLSPMNEWIGEDLNGNGIIDDDEAKWAPWKDIPPLWRQVVTRDGKVYGIPQQAKYYMGVIFRTDMARAAGLNPNDTPETWEELIYWSQRLTDPDKEITGAVVSKGQRGIALTPYGFVWLPWMQSAGGDPIIQVRIHPETGEEFIVPPDTINFTAPDGTVLPLDKATWRANFDHPAGIAAAGLYHRLRWMKWLILPSGEPHELRQSEFENGVAMINGRKVSFEEKDVTRQVRAGDRTFTVTLDQHLRGEAEVGGKTVSFAPEQVSATVVDPETGDRLELEPLDLQRYYTRVGGEEYPFAAADVISGVARGQTGARGTGAWELMGRGEVAMTTWFVQDLNSVGNSVGVDPDLLSWFPFPAAPGGSGRRVVQIQQHYATMAEGVDDRPKEQRDKCWKVITAITDQQVADEGIRQKVLSGLARFVNPADLERLGYEDYLKEIPSDIRENYAAIESGEVATFTEPYMGFWVTMDGALNSQIISLIIAETGEDFGYAGALRQVTKEANSGLMFGIDEKTLKRYRPRAAVVFVVIVIFMIGCMVFIVRSWLRKDKGGVTRSVYTGITPWLILLPALLLIGLWRYYPLLRGMVMAFQDYRIAGETTWVGLDNFIELWLDTDFWMSLLRTVLFVFLNLILAFTAPIILALLLSEAPKFRYALRTIFFLPQITSGLVIALLWKLMYEPTAQGFLNQVITAFRPLNWLLVNGANVIVWLINLIPFVPNFAYFNLGTQTWLEDPRLAMVCCVVPTVWATMGMSSLIYLAALKSVPEELYEAADVDGAGIFTKLRKITLPTLMPLIIINFVGAFIGTFQNMGNIFLMTFGGPGRSTMVAGMKIWIEAYNNLRFSMATSMAWVLGALLIGFTFVQIQFLKRVEFKKASWD